MDVHEALYTTRMMRRMRPDPVPLETQCRILDAAIRAPNGGNTQRWHFLAVDDPNHKRRLAELYRECRELECRDLAAGTLGMTVPGDDAGRTETMRKIKASGGYFTDHFEEIPLLIFVFAVDDHGGANIYPAIWSAFLAARAEGVGGVMSTVLRYAEDTVTDMLGVPVEQGWRLTAMLAFGYPLGRWGVAANRRPVHEVASRNHWSRPFGAEVPEPLWSGPAESSAS
ncbi:nitroreductase family protein [Actinomadura madurae]|uniref:nitroreductase family protein n=1 Tax=Actinomadura madurae TaxID=1993 RepID=UPI003999BF7F